VCGGFPGHPHSPQGLCSGCSPRKQDAGTGRPTALPGLPATPLSLGEGKTKFGVKLELIG
jgi:hypothetical protein